jgi:hypothetical protein
MRMYWTGRMSGVRSLDWLVYELTRLGKCARDICTREYRIALVRSGIGWECFRVRELTRKGYAFAQTGVVRG